MVSTSAPLSDFQEAEGCHTCGKSFGYVFTRRHHCRRCLRSFCDECCDAYYPIFGNPTPVRHCAECAKAPAEAELKAEALSQELATLEIQITDAVTAEEYTVAAELKARREELEAALEAVGSEGR